MRSLLFHVLILLSLLSCRFGKVKVITRSDLAITPTPEVALATVTGAPTGTNNSTALSAVIIGGTNIATYLYKIIAGNAAGCANPAGYSGSQSVATTLGDSYSGLADGLITLCVVGTTVSGTVQDFASATSETWTKDILAPRVPQLTRTSPVDSPSTTATASFTASDLEIGTTVEFSEIDLATGTYTFLQSLTASASVHIFNVTLLVPSSKAYVVRATDSAGNISQYSIHARHGYTTTIFFVDVSATLADQTPGDGICDIGTGNCGLTAAIQEANALNIPVIISDNSGGASILSALTINNSVRIDSLPGSTSYVGNGNFPLFNVPVGAHLEITGVDMSNFGDGGLPSRGIIYGAGDIKLSSCVVGPNAELNFPAIYISAPGRAEFRDGAIASVDSGIIGNGAIFVSNSQFTGSLGGVGVNSFGPVEIIDSYFEDFTLNSSNLNCSKRCLIQNSWFDSGDLYVYEPTDDFLVQTVITTNNLFRLRLKPVGTADITVMNSTSYNSELRLYKSSTLGSDFHLRNSIFDGGGGPSCTVFVAGVSLVNSVNSLFDDTNTCGAVGTMISNVSPNLDATTLIPLGGSPAIDAGSALYCPITDYGTNPRPVDKLGGGAKCDIGAYEVQ